MSHTQKGLDSGDGILGARTVAKSQGGTVVCLIIPPLRDIWLLKSNIESLF